MKKILRLVILVLISTNVHSQTMEWVLITNSQNSGTCTSATDCDANTLCYGLQYTPNGTGILTSYSTGFFATCVSDGSDIKISNSSCVMNDNSTFTNNCATDNIHFFNSSGNSGSISVVSGAPIIIHQLCLTIPSGQSVQITEDDISDLTTNIDLTTGGSQDEFPSYNSFTINRNVVCQTLPVELTGFDVESDGVDAELRWETASELNNSHFEVERSVDGRSWDYVGRVEGKGTTGREQSYSYIDVGIGRKLSTVYYRLIQVDYDGSESESEVRVVNFEHRGGEVSIYPNPVISELNVNYTGGDAYRVMIYDMMGKLVSGSKGGSKIDMSEYKGGTYTVRVMDGSGSMLKTESVVVIR